jgi:hypothetical protein
MWACAALREAHNDRASHIRRQVSTILGLADTPDPETRDWGPADSGTRALLTALRSVLCEWYRPSYRSNTHLPTTHFSHARWQLTNIGLLPGHLADVLSQKNTREYLRTYGSSQPFEDLSRLYMTSAWILYQRRIYRYRALAYSEREPIPFPVGWRSRTGGATPHDAVWCTNRTPFF